MHKTLILLSFFISYFSIGQTKIEFKKILTPTTKSYRIFTNAFFNYSYNKYKNENCAIYEMQLDGRQFIYSNYLNDSAKTNKFFNLDSSIWIYNIDSSQQLKKQLNSGIGILVFVKNGFKQYIFDHNFNKNFDDDKIYKIPLNNLNIKNSKNLDGLIKVKLNYDYVDNKKIFHPKHIIYIRPFRQPNFKTTNDTSLVFGGYYYFSTEYKVKINNSLSIVYNSEKPIPSVRKFNKEFYVYKNSSQIFNREIQLKEEFVINDIEYTVDSIANDLSHLIYTKRPKKKIYYGFEPGNILDSVFVNQVINRFGKDVFNNQYTLIDYFGTWCGPCIGALPDLTYLNENYKSKLKIITIAVEQKDDLAEFEQKIKKLKINWDVVRDLFSNSPENRIKKTIPGFPVYLLVDKNKKIILTQTFVKRGFREEVMKIINK